MNWFRSVLFFVLLFAGSVTASERWNANWIADPDGLDEANSWLCFKKEVHLKKIPAKVIAKISVDSKYWLWVNGEQVVFEGGLKRGPNPKDTYYDEVDIAAYLHPGINSVSVLTWYFGKNGFSHVSSGKAALFFECTVGGQNIWSDSTWKVIRNPAFKTASLPMPNVRLSESSIRFESSLDLGRWQAKDYDASWWKNAMQLGVPPTGPWNKLVLRPIPQWKNAGLKDYTGNPIKPFVCSSDTVVSCRLPYNCQVTPYLKIESPAGLLLDIRTDNFNGGGPPNVKAEYITHTGVQEYESYGWMNGHQVKYTIPKGVKVLELKYRETGYDTEFAGSFRSSDDFLNRLREKSLRTLYVTMRDNYMDCPDRERAQWWGDEVIESGEAFYTLCPKSHLLLRKGMYELIGWQRADSTLFSPIPSVTYKSELPCQMLTSVGFYGFWNYYLQTGDKKTISDLYDGVRKYLAVWKTHPNGTVITRSGGWNWGDWGKEKDMELITNALYYMALKGAANMAEVLDKTKDKSEYLQKMNRLKASYNREFWTGSAYRFPTYKDKTDDRSQALAVVSGLADSDKYPALLQVFKTEEHASPYMEKYVLEALFQMDYADFALERMKKRFAFMVNHPDYSTLFEGWGIGKDGFGGGTVNHAWSGGALTLLSQYLCGIAPLKPGYSLFQVLPQPASVEQASAVVPTVRGLISSSFVNKPNQFDLTVSVPDKTEAVVGIPNKGFSSILVDDKKVWENGQFLENKNVKKFDKQENGFILFLISDGKKHFVAVK